MTAPRFSVVINTDGRGASLVTTLDSLRWLTGPDFEVCVVTGPTPDGTPTLLDKWSGSVKTAHCSERNLSISRNIGIRLAAGDVVAFLDDDAVPEPEWLAELAAAYEDGRTGGAGGFVHNPDGVTYQYRLGTADRLGAADLSWQRPAPELCFPFTANYPHLLGANSSFRRDALVGAGGFDEEYEYYLDETDLACRLVDAGWRIAQVEGAHVHHKFLPSELRSADRVLTNWYPILKNRIYFGLLNGLRHHSINTVIEQARGFIGALARDMDWAIGAGRLDEASRTRFWQDVDRAWRDGLARGLAGIRRLADPALLTAPPPAFQVFPALRPGEGQHCFCFLSQDYPPRPVGGIGRYIHALARGVAALGHQVHVLTPGNGHDRVDFEEGVWVRRVLATPDDECLASALAVPPRIAGHAARMAREVRAVTQRRPVAAAYAPIWDCEGLALLDDGRTPVVLALQTTLHFWLESHPQKREDQEFMADFARPMLAAEARLLREAHGVHAISAAIARDVEEAYDMGFDPARIAVIRLGLVDRTALPAEPPAPLPAGSLRLLFVGRLEPRKGIKVLLAVATDLLTRYPHLHLDIVGNGSITDSDGRLHQEAFAADRKADAIRDRVRFHGEVSEERLSGFYAACDILVTPSLFESFGLMLVEGMMFGKPVIGCRAGGMVEVVEDGVSGLLAEPGDAASLEACLERLITDAGLRAKLGAAARARFEQHFTVERMAGEVAAFLTRVAERGSGIVTQGLAA